MPNILDANGLQVMTRQELLNRLTADYRRIYGQDINLESSTPDGQMMNIYIQGYEDILDLIVMVYNSFNPDLATGKVLDQRLLINGIQRQGATYTFTNITLINSESVTLYGIDARDAGTIPDGAELYTISDNQGNQYNLFESQLGLAPGTHTLIFRALEPGEQLTVPNTITTMVTVILGVTSVNNPTTYITLGQNEESEMNAKIRREKSVAISSNGFVRPLEALLRNIPGITFARVAENKKSTTENTIPPHSIWVIIDGVASDAEIAEAIYSKRGAGAGMKGEQTYIIIDEVNGDVEIRWDNVFIQPVFVVIDTESINGTELVDFDDIKAALIAAIRPEIGESINSNMFVAPAYAADPNAIIEDVKFFYEDAQSFVLGDEPDGGSIKFWANGELTPSIPYNASEADIQTAIRTITGLENVIVSGTLTGEFVSFLADDLWTLGLIGAPESENLLTVGGNPVPVSLANGTLYAKKLSPTSIAGKLTLTPDNIIMLPMQIAPIDSTVETEDEVTFTAKGGFKPYSYRISIDNSGASIDPETGEYVAGMTPGTDTVVVTDSLGNLAFTTIEVE